MVVVSTHGWKPLFGCALLSAMLTVTLGRFLCQIPGGLVPDDGYFYAGIARHLAIDGKSSFDGIHLTDGYHQLWQYLLAALAWPIVRLTESRSALLGAFLWLDLCVLLVLTWFVGRNWTERLFVLTALGGCEFLMEGHLLALLIALTALPLVDESRKWSPGVSIAACALIPLARIDAALIPLILAVTLLGTRQYKRGAQLAIATAAGVIIHFCLMFTLHGSWWSVSSQIKSGASGHGIRLLHNLGQRTPTLPIPFEPQAAFVLSLAVLGAWLVAKGPKPALWGLWLGTALFTLAHLVLSDVHPWYFAPALVAFPCVMIYACPERAKAPGVLYGAAVSVLLLGALCFKAWSNRNEAKNVVAFITRLNAVVPDGSTLFMVDGSGYVGYFSSAPVVNGDGLVNSHSYASDLRSNRLGGYLDRNGIRYVVENKPLSPTDLLVDIGGLRVSQRQARPILTKQGNGGYFFTNLVLWRLNEPYSAGRGHGAAPSERFRSLVLSQESFSGASRAPQAKSR